MERRETESKRGVGRCSDVTPNVLTIKHVVKISRGSRKQTQNKNKEGETRALDREKERTRERERERENESEREKYIYIVGCSGIK